MDPLCRDENGKVFKKKVMEDAVANYVVIQCGVRRLAPPTVIKTYLPGIAATMDRLQEECADAFRTASNSKEVKLVGKGFTNQYNKKNPQSGRMKLPFAMDLAEKSIGVMKQNRCFDKRGVDSEIFQLRIFVAMTVGIYFLLRCSEHIGSKTATAVPLTRKHVTFFDKTGTPIRYNDIGIITADKVTLNIEFSKTDLSGFGRRCQHTRQEGSKVCVVNILERWISTTRDDYNAKETDLLYEIPGFGTLKVKHLNEVMQLVIDSLGIPGTKKRLTSHSLRYGGATMMAAAGFPFYIIAIYGGWSQDSKTLRMYTKASEQMVELVSKHMATMAGICSSVYFINDLFVIEKAKKN